MKDLKVKYPQLEKIDKNKPINLFVGAFERKGLKKVLKLKDKNDDFQLIIVGKPESGKSFTFSEDIVYISHTNEIELFYAISDNFIFPTIYEPFGLVLLEAAVMGLNVYTLKSKVGASELLHDLKGIYLFDDEAKIELVDIKVLTNEEKKSRREERLKRFKAYTWEKTGKNFQDLLFSSNRS